MKKFPTAPMVPRMSFRVWLTIAPPPDAMSPALGNAAGSTTSAAAHLTVLQPVVITLQPASVTVTTGKNTTLKVQASGTGPLTYQWRKNGVPITGATDNKLALTGVQGSDAGNYDVVVTNAAGSVTSAAAVLSVHYLGFAH